MKDLILNNGQTAKFVRMDDWSRPIYELESGRGVCCVNMDGTYLHTMSLECGEPDTPLIYEYQPVTRR